MSLTRNVTGDTVTLTATFAGDPTEVTAVVTDPTGTATTYSYIAAGTITRASLGVFTKTLACTTNGTWSAVFTGTGTYAGVQDGTWDIFQTESAAPPLYCSLEELKAVVFSGGVSADTNDDALLQIAREGAARWIDGYTQRPQGFGKRTDTRTYIPDTWAWCDIDDLVTVTTIKTATTDDGTYDTTWTVGTDYQLLSGGQTNTNRYGVTWPYDRVAIVGPRSFPAFSSGIRQSLQIVGVWGWPAVPPGVRNAAITLAFAAYKRKDSPGGIMGGFQDYGPVRVGTRIDPDVEKWLAQYRDLRGTLVG